MERNAKLGIRFFAVYLLFYLAFVLTNTFAPELMERTPLLGVNLAILSGFGLIFAAFIMALLYGWACSDHPRGSRGKQGLPTATDQATNTGESR